MRRAILVAANPGEVLGHFALIQRRVHVNVEIAPDGILLIEHVLFGGLDAGRRIVLLHLEVLGAGAVGRPAVANAILILGHGLEDGRGPRHGLRAGDKVGALEDVLLEELVGAGTVFAAVNGDQRARAANPLAVIFPA